ncbi:NYN domain-containing protein [Phellopilus nigrolimitatus]|nr:NYN domain-containing protein [Phellopilus nigrolimitatus]
MSSPSQVAVFWDYGTYLPNALHVDHVPTSALATKENCRPPSNVSGFSVVDRIRRIVQDFGNTTVFKAYVDLSLECANARSMIHSELQSSGLSIIHCPHNGRKDVADKMMLVDMLAFAIDSPAPATIVLITGDRDFAYAAAILRLRGYEVIIIASSFIAHASLKSQGCRLYDWQKVVVGNDGSPAAKAGDIRADESLLTETTALSTGLLVSTSLPSYSKSKHAVPTTNTSTKSSTTKKSASKPAAGHPSWADMIRVGYTSWSKHLWGFISLCSRPSFENRFAVFNHLISLSLEIEIVSIPPRYLCMHQNKIYR